MQYVPGAILTFIYIRLKEPPAKRSLVSSYVQRCGCTCVPDLAYITAARMKKYQLFLELYEAGRGPSMIEYSFL